MRKLIGSVESAAIFGVSQATFNRWVAAGRVVPAVNMSGKTGARLYDAALIGRLAKKYQRVGTIDAA